MDELRDEKALLAEADSLKKMAFIGIAISTFSILTAALIIPMLFGYTQAIQSSIEEELVFCSSRSRDLYDEYEKVSNCIHLNGKYFSMLI